MLSLIDFSHKSMQIRQEEMGYRVFMISQLGSDLYKSQLAIIKFTYTCFYILYSVIVVLWTPLDLLKSCGCPYASYMVKSFFFKGIKVSRNVNGIS